MLAAYVELKVDRKMLVNSFWAIFRLFTGGPIDMEESIIIKFADTLPICRLYT